MVPVSRTLPEGWRPVDPTEAGAPGAAFVAVHAGLGQDVTLTRRTTHDSAEVPGLSQLVTFSISMAGSVRKLVQYQVFLALVDAENPSRRMVIEAALTVTPQEFDNVATDFGTFLSSIRLDSGEPTPAGTPRQ